MFDFDYGSPYNGRMCGRMTLHTPKNELEAAFDLKGLPELEPRYNIAPTQPLLIVREGPGGVREAAWTRWGLVPSWAKDPSIGSRMINARAETAFDKPAFRSAMKRRRCLIPISGFYEWKKGSGKVKQPYFIHRPDGAPLALAGIHEYWEGHDGAFESSALLTCGPNGVMEAVHDRMPVILHPDAWDTWLDGTVSREGLEMLLVPCPDHDLVLTPVSTAVNNPRNQGAELIAAVAA